MYCLLSLTYFPVTYTAQIRDYPEGKIAVFMAILPTRNHRNSCKNPRLKELFIIYNLID